MGGACPDRGPVRAATVSSWYNLCQEAAQASHRPLPSTLGQSELVILEGLSKPKSSTYSQAPHDGLTHSHPVPAFAQMRAKSAVRTSRIPERGALIGMIRVTAFILGRGRSEGGARCWHDRLLARQASWQWRPPPGFSGQRQRSERIPAGRMPLGWLEERPGATRRICRRTNWKTAGFSSTMSVVPSSGGYKCNAQQVPTTTLYNCSAYSRRTYRM